MSNNFSDLINNAMLMVESIFPRKVVTINNLESYEEMKKKMVDYNKEFELKAHEAFKKAHEKKLQNKK